jgi:hypothetical protein
VKSHGYAVELLLPCITIASSIEEQVRRARRASRATPLGAQTDRREPTVLIVRELRHGGSRRGVPGRVAALVAIRAGARLATTAVTAVCGETYRDARAITKLASLRDTARHK